MKKISKDTKVLLIDLFFHIVFVISIMIPIFTMRDGDWGIWIILSDILLAYCIYSLLSLFFLFIFGENIPKVFLPRVLFTSLIFINSEKSILFSAAYAVLMAIGFIAKAQKNKTSIYEKKDVSVFKYTIILSIIIAAICIITIKTIRGSYYMNEFMYALCAILFIIGLLHGIFSCAVLKKARAWFYSFLIVSHLPIFTIAGSLVGVVITRLIIYLKDRNKKQLNEAQSENDG